jgi:hypothetical protein
VAFTITEKEGTPMVAVDRRLWLDAEGKLVEDGDPAAAVLFSAGPGDEVDPDVAKRAGYKAKAKPADKRRAAPKNKSA